MVVATLFAAIYSIGAKRLVANYEPVVVTTVVAILGALFLFPLTIWEVGGLAGLPSLLALPPIAWLALLLLGLGAGALANIWWMRILGSTTAARAGMTLFLIPVISTTLAVVALGETLTPVALIGASPGAGGRRPGRTRSSAGCETRRARRHHRSVADPITFLARPTVGLRRDAYCCTWHVVLYLSSASTIAGMT